MDDGEDAMEFVHAVFLGVGAQLDKHCLQHAQGRWQQGKFYHEMVSLV